MRSVRLSRRSFIATLGGLTAASSLVRPSSAADTFTMRLNLSTAANSANALAALRLAVAVNRRSNGRLKIEVYPSGQLASEVESIDALINGVLDLAMQAAANLVPLVPQLQVFDLPFLVRNLDVGHRIVDGPIGTELFSQLQPKGLVELGCAGVLKELETTTKAIVRPEDMKGLRIRIQNSPVFAATYRALGAVPVPLDNNETLVALTQHAVDGIDINLDAAAAGKFYTVIRHVAMSHHFFTINTLIGSKRKIDALPPDLKTILIEESKANNRVWRSLFAERIADDIKLFKDNGSTFTEIQYAAFRKAVEPVYATYEGRFGGLIDRITRAAG